MILSVDQNRLLGCNQIRLLIVARNDAGCPDSRPAWNEQPCLTHILGKHAADWLQGARVLHARLGAVSLHCKVLSLVCNA